MGAHVINSQFLRRRPRRRALALALGLCALVIPTSATAQATDSDYATVNAISGDSNGSSQDQAGSDYSSVNAITGAPTDEPTFVSSPTGGANDAFDWPSALVGAGAALALAALGSAAVLTIRRRTPISASGSTG
jgi:hypothetical protein